MELIDIKSLDYDELLETMAQLGEKTFRGKQVYQWLHEKSVTSFDEMTNLSKALREKLQQQCYIAPVTEITKLTSKDKATSKFLFGLKDGSVIESVLMKYKHGNSVCISSQVGCRMGCNFCASTLGGLERNLTVSEMLGQIYAIQNISGERVSNVVVMGTGEPMDNYDNFVKFVRMLTDEHGYNISQRNITVSTCGLVEKIKQLADEKFSITLAISLHAPNDEARRRLMPIANKYSIKEIMEACDYYFEKTGRRVSFEYSLVQGENDSEEFAKQLGALLKGKNCHVNLIPVNPIKERDYKDSDATFVKNFKVTLEKLGINVTIRREMGRDIDAACGQLRRSYINKKEEE
ncbi:MAG: 23S rRNA (adenine(2503)-C(2))-methyltransferase RlmN [Lachnospiraceae bacterium]|jgi:23S rRNA (adenine2503-C2)-methyltransferase|nr:23S rRNA (adenine(2503)-C(2))-methyltransferase RlmN [Lachnospiraceae bacterium]MCR4802700.1 23S rRNA (adenine(2503)-C(2))-methyltransferase RlmN [Lachnospiraceae bacterium]